MGKGVLMLLILAALTAVSVSSRMPSFTNWLPEIDRIACQPKPNLAFKVFKERRLP